MVDYNEKILQRLVNDMHLPESQAILLREDILALDGDLKTIFDKWLEDITCTANYEAHGFSIFILMKKYKMTFPAALLTLDWIIKEPEIAIKAIKASFF